MDGFLEFTTDKFCMGDFSWSPHAQRMFAVFLAFDESERPSGYSAFVAGASLDTAPILTAGKIRSGNSMIFRGLMPADVLASFAPQLAQKEDWASTVEGFGVSALASDLLSQELLTDLLPIASPLAKAAIKANPNSPAGIAEPLGVSQAQMYCGALARHGEMKTALGRARMMDLVVASTNQHAALRPEWRGELCLRADLPKEFIEPLLDTVQAEHLDSLFRLPASRELVIAGGLGWRKTASGLSLSPELSADDISKCSTFLTLKKMGHRIQLAGHNNAPDSVFDVFVDKTILNEQNASRLAQALASSDGEKAAERLLKVNTISGVSASHVGRCTHASPDIMHEAAKRVFDCRRSDTLAMVSLVSNKNFPWDRWQTDDLLSATERAAHGAIRCAQAIAGHFEHAKGGLTTPELAVAALFSESASGHRLDSIANKFPALRAAACLHPNGHDVSTKGLSSEHKKRVGALRQLAAPSALPGRSSQKALIRGPAVLTM